MKRFSMIVLLVVAAIGAFNIAQASRVSFGINIGPYPAPYPNYYPDYYYPAPYYPAYYPPTQMAWIPGHWSYGRWIPGHYVEYIPPQPGPGFVWIQGFWGQGHAWHHGYWHAR